MGAQADPLVRGSATGLHGPTLEQRAEAAAGGPFSCLWEGLGPAPGFLLARFDGGEGAGSGGACSPAS